MKIYPAIDLMDGQCVRLKKGDFDTKEVLRDAPLEVAAEYRDKGCEFLHLVDLDGAKAGEPRHTELIAEICRQSGLKVQAGGGLRSLEHAEALVRCGVDRVVLGSLAVRDKPTTERILETLGGERVTIAIDAHPTGDSGDYFVATSGWLETSDTIPEEVVRYYGERGVRSFLCTDISKDGMMAGPGLDLYRRLQAALPGYEFQASGGIRHQGDLRELKELGLGAAIIGKALYQETLTIEEALSC